MRPGKKPATDVGEIIDEISAIMCFFSDTLRLLPDRVRLMMCCAIEVEMVARDTLLLSPGDEVDKFMVILSGKRRSTAS